jgi:hypothetical protein
MVKVWKSLKFGQFSHPVVDQLNEQWLQSVENQTERKIFQNSTVVNDNETTFRDEVSCVEKAFYLFINVNSSQGDQMRLGKKSPKV